MWTGITQAEDPSACISREPEGSQILSSWHTLVQNSGSQEGYTDAVRCKQMSFLVLGLGSFALAGATSKGNEEMVFGGHAQNWRKKIITVSCSDSGVFLASRTSEALLTGLVALKQAIGR